MGIDMDFIKNILNSPIIDSPWPHQIVDNFLDEQTFKSLETLANSLLPNYSIKKGQSIDPIDLVVMKNKMNPDLYDRLLMYNKLLLDHNEDLLTLYPHHRSYQKYYSMPSFHFMDRDAGWHHIHDETRDKALSIVLYINPEISAGTKIFSGMQEKDFEFEVKWKKNRALIFCGVEGVTWHSFGTEKYPRATLNFFLRENNLPCVVEETDNKLVLLYGDQRIETVDKTEEVTDILNLIRNKQVVTDY
jgi:hypothetical protein